MRLSVHAALALFLVVAANALAVTPAPLSDADSSPELKAAGDRRLLDHTHEDGEEHDHYADVAVNQLAADAPAAATGTVTGTLAPSLYLGTYSVEDDDYGTMVEVVVTDTTREIMTNAIPPWETPFPVPANPNAVEAQNITWSLPLDPVSPFRNSPETVREFGISVLGISYEPGNAQRAQCEDGSELRIEAFNNSDVDFGIDDNGAHVRDTTGAYHYHTLPNGEIALADESQDIVHIGFAFDSHLLYYSRSGAYTSSYVLSTEPRSGGVCTYSEPDIPEFELSATPDGTITEDWVFSEGAGDLDECNGITIDGEFAYFVTDTFPFIPRCHMGESTAGDGVTDGGGDAMGGGMGGMPGADGPAADGPTADGDTGAAAAPSDATDTDDAAATDAEIASGAQSQTVYQAVGAVAGAVLLSVLM